MLKAAKSKLQYELQLSITYASTLGSKPPKSYVSGVLSKGEQNCQI